jgi:multiple sugar transport system permease protein
MPPDSLTDMINIAGSRVIVLQGGRDMIPVSQDLAMQAPRAPHLTRCQLSRIGIWAAISLALVWTLFPIWWAIASSLKPLRLQYDSLMLPGIQFPATVEHWRWEWRNRYEINGLYSGLRNSLIASLVTATLCASIGTLTAIGLRAFRGQTRTRTGVIALALLPRILPPVVLLTPLTLLTIALRIQDTLASLVAVYTCIGLPVSIVVLDAALRDIPADIIDAARLDGASDFTVTHGIVVPLLAPVLWAVGVLTFAFSWNEFMFAVTNARYKAMTAPISVAFLDQRDGVDFEHVGSHIVLIIAIPLILAMLTQGVLVRGLTLGAVRG